MSQDLFRKEVFEARRSNWLGGISLVQPVSLWGLAVCAAIAASMVALYFLLGSYTWRSTVSGQLVPNKGLAVVVAPASGVVSELKIVEGDEVSEGQPLAIVTVPRATITVGDTVKALEDRLEQRRQGLLDSLAAEQEILAAQEAGLSNQLVQAKRELAQVESEIDTRRDQIQIAEETLQRLRQLEDERYVSLLQIKQQESNALSWRAELQSMQRQATTIARGVTQLEQNLRELPEQLRMAEAGYRRDLAMLDQEQVETQASGALSVNAPVSGVVAVQVTKLGQAVQAGQPILILMPSGSALEAELLVPSRAVGFVEPGDSVLLRYQAYPYQKFGHHAGIVSRISRSAIDPRQIQAPGSNQNSGEPYYRVTVDLVKQTVPAYGREEQLMPGMSLDADILGERRRLIEWLLEPIYSIQGKRT